MTEVPVADIAPLDPATIKRQHPDIEMPELAAHVVSSLGNPDSDTRSRIEIWLDRDPDDVFDEFINTLTHEIHHDVIHHVVGPSASFDLDNVAGQGTYLRKGQIDI